MGLPWNPEPEESLMARYDGALSRVYDIRSITEGKSDRPGQHRDNVFDFEDGFRIIISKEKLGGKLYVHVSGSLRSNKKVSPDEILKGILVRAVALSRGTIQGQAQISKTEQNVIHILLMIGPDWIEKIVQPSLVVNN